jgi:L-fuconolactonase
VRWSERERTWIKLSSLAPPTQYPHRDLGPVVRRVAAAYGAGRLLWGGGFDARATAESYRAARERARALVAHLSAAEQAEVLGGTAAKLFGFAA